MHIYNVNAVNQNLFQVLPIQRLLSCNVWRREILFDKNPFIIQTPWLCAKLTESTIDAFLTSSPEPRLKEKNWFSFMLKIQNSFKKWIKSSHPLKEWFDITNTEEISLVKLRFPIKSSVEWYDGLQNKSNITNIGLTSNSSNTQIRLVLHLTYVWYNKQDSTGGLQWNILQGQHCSVNPPTVCIFNKHIPHSYPVPATAQPPPPPIPQPPPPPESADRTAHPIYGKYFKMINMGIPLPAAKQKMKMSGLDEKILDLPPNAPLPSVTSDNKQESSEIQDIKLKKTVVNDRTKIIDKSSAGHGISLGDIVNGLRSLRKTFQKNNHKDETSSKKNDSSPTSLQHVKLKQNNSLLLDLFKNRH